MKHLKTFEGYEKEFNKVETFQDFQPNREIENQPEKMRSRVEEYQVIEVENEAGAKEGVNI